MTIYTLHIFDNKGSCLFDKEWVRNKTSSLPKEQEIKLMFGMIHSINSFVSKMSPCDLYPFFESLKMLYGWKYNVLLVFILAVPEFHSFKALQCFHLLTKAVCLLL